MQAAEEKTTSTVSDSVSDSVSGTAVLQPQSLIGNEGETFYQALDGAIAQSSAVIIDLLWVETLETETLKPLVNAFLNAQIQGKPLTFLAMDQDTRIQFEQLTQQGSRIDRTNSYGVFAPEFEAFLEQHHQVKSAAALR
jgi:anti-anti-sigma regulatory factor